MLGRARIAGAGVAPSAEFGLAQINGGGRPERERRGYPNVKTPVLDRTRRSATSIFMNFFIDAPAYPETVLASPSRHGPDEMAPKTRAAVVVAFCDAGDAGVSSYCQPLSRPWPSYQSNSTLGSVTGLLPKRTGVIGAGWLSPAGASSCIGDAPSSPTAS